MDSFLLKRLLYCCKDSESTRSPEHYLILNNNPNPKRFFRLLEAFDLYFSWHGRMFCITAWPDDLCSGFLTLHNPQIPLNLSSHFFFFVYFPSEYSIHQKSYIGVELITKFFSIDRDDTGRHVHDVDIDMHIYVIYTHIHMIKQAYTCRVSNIKCC